MYRVTNSSTFSRGGQPAVRCTTTERTSIMPLPKPFRHHAWPFITRVAGSSLKKAERRDSSVLGINAPFANADCISFILAGLNGRNWAEQSLCAVILMK